MSVTLMLLLAFAATPFESAIDRAFSEFQTKNWAAVAADLDAAVAQDPAAFAANNFHYLRGRVAENQADWQRARTAFANVETGNPLYPLALWRSARAALRLHDDAAATQLLATLPLNFPSDLKLELAGEAGGSLALEIYQQLSSREARYRRAAATADFDALWGLVRESGDDDVAMEAAQLLAPMAAGAADSMTLAAVFAGQRQFQEALSLYQAAAADSAYAPDARSGIARIYFQQEKYSDAIAEYRAVAREFADTDWEKDSEYQIANCYWRLGEFRNAERAYLDYLRKYGETGMSESATRNLVDVYRVLDENQKALSTLDRALAGRLSAASRQVFLFTKAKILYTEKRYSAALAIFQQLGRVRLRAAPGNATAEEVQYFQALCQSKLGNRTAARTIWKKLAGDSFSYYAQRAAEKLSQSAKEDSPAGCSADRSDHDAIAGDLESLRHAVRNEFDPASDVVSELVFLRLWDDAAYWMNWSGRPLPPRQAAEVSYLAGQYSRAIGFATRLGDNDWAMPLRYPAGFHSVICRNAAAYMVDPLWLKAIIWQESKYNPSAHSGAAARGLMQFIPETAQAVAASIGAPAPNLAQLYDPALSIQLGAAYWASLLNQFKSPEMALAAYNGGPENVNRWRSKSSDPELFVADIGFTETKKYVMLVFSAHAGYSALERGGLK